MSLKQWADNGWLKPHRTSYKEIKNLLDIVDRDMLDARSSVSTDWRFGIAYNAALKLCTILLYAADIGRRENYSIIAHWQLFPRFWERLGKRMQNILMTAGRSGT